MTVWRTVLCRVRHASQEKGLQNFTSIGGKQSEQVSDDLLNKSNMTLLYQIFDVAISRRFIWAVVAAWIF